MTMLETLVGGYCKYKSSVYSCLLTKSILCLFRSFHKFWPIDCLGALFSCLYVFRKSVEYMYDNTKKYQLQGNDDRERKGNALQKVNVYFNFKFVKYLYPLVQCV